MRHGARGCSALVTAGPAGTGRGASLQIRCHGCRLSAAQGGAVGAARESSLPPRPQPQPRSLLTAPAPEYPVRAWRGATTRAARAESGGERRHVGTGRGLGRRLGQGGAHSDGVGCRPMKRAHMTQVLPPARLLVVRSSRDPARPIRPGTILYMTCHKAVLKCCREQGVALRRDQTKCS